MYKFIIPIRIFLDWFRKDKYTEYITYAELQNAYEKGEINGIHRTG